jgi:hypothetical protein
MMRPRRLQDYVRAFVGALRLTLRGQTPPPALPRYPQLSQWAAQGLRLTAAAFAAAEAAGLDDSARRQRRLRLEGRDISMHTILAAARHNLSEEYPRLLGEKLAYNLTALYAFNMNDHFRLSRLAETLDDAPAVQQAIHDLAQHLAAVPSEKEATASMT